MAHIDQLLERNKGFAATRARDGITISGRLPVWVLTCVDPRTDPSALLELTLGDATVFRNAGGRVTPDMLRELEAKAVVNPEQTVRVDVELLRHAAILPATITISGHVYDVATGLITTIVPAAPMHAVASTGR